MTEVDHVTRSAMDLLVKMWGDKIVRELATPLPYARNYPPPTPEQRAAWRQRHYEEHMDKAAKHILSALTFGGDPCECDCL